jgi:hypothetical protein
MDARQIDSATDAVSFIQGMDIAKQNLPHWQMARQALQLAGISEASEDLAWREFRDALIFEGWLSSSDASPA